MPPAVPLPTRPAPTGPTAAACLDALRTSLLGAADAWVETSLAAKGWTDVPHARAEEWASGPLPVARFLARLAQGRGLAPAHDRSVDGCSVHAAATLSGGDRLLLFGHSAELHVGPDQPGTGAANGGIGLVLGAGNVTATPILDVLEQVFVHGRAVVCKPSPLHDRMVPVFAQALQPLLAASVVTFAHGDAAVGQDLAHDPRVTAVHLTGSHHTWAALRFDPALVGKDLTAEVGCCTPALVLPGAWPERELAAMARQLAAYVACNGGATCLAPRALLTPQHWPERVLFLQMLTRELAALPARVPFHPGVRAHWERVRGRPSPGAALPPCLVEDRRDPAAWAGLREEPFAPALQEFTLPAEEYAAFVGAHCFGRLSAYVFASRATLQKDRAGVRRVAAALPHGTVAVNTWTGLGYGLGTTPWGVPPSSPTEFGCGTVRNTTGRVVQRTIVQAPLRPLVTPPWLPQHRNGAAALRALTRHVLRPTVSGFVRTALHALRS
ncbi:MAG: aldehyde dehydrogenase [Planctomycetes bacterium]|nr:aldehyde dehydrogenase [Planctomycetota bacterium]